METVIHELELRGPYTAVIAFAVLLVLVMAVEAVREARADRPSFTCPDCGARSWHPEDIRHGYCGRCHAYTGRSDAVRVPTQRRPA